MREVFIFIDGIGLAPPAPDNPVTASVCPALCELISEHSKPVDANLDVDGLPQSATGQAAIFTGKNAAKHMKRHVEGFPGPTLRRFVETDNVFLSLKTIGLKAKFADAYIAETVDEIRNRRFRSVTTTAALTVPETISLRNDLLANRAVLHDITRASLIPKGITTSLISPEDAAEHLVQLALGYDYTLFEYFLTDRAGHSGDIDLAVETLRTLDRFLAGVFSLASEMGMSVTLTSDHGNIESIGLKGHTRNPVPLIATGPGAREILDASNSLTDITPALISLLTDKQRKTAL